MGGTEMMMDEELYDPECSACERAQKDYADLERVTDDLAALVRKAVEAEREMCANLCEQQRFGIDAFGSIDHHVRQAAEQCAAAIRARR